MAGRRRKKEDTAEPSGQILVEGDKNQRMGCIVINLLPLKILLFCFFGGIGSLVPFLPIHMEKAGLTQEQNRIVSMVAPCISLLGPLVAGPAVDRLGRHKIFLAGCLIFGAIFYSLLLNVPIVSSYESRKPPAVRFHCNSEGASVVQAKCVHTEDCYSWTESDVGLLQFGKCDYVCYDDPEGSGDDESDGSGVALALRYENNSDPLEASLDNLNLTSIPMDEEIEEKRPPHLCFKDARGKVVCHVYTADTIGLAMNISLPHYDDQEHQCIYPIEHFSINDNFYESLTCRTKKPTCNVYCNILNPYVSGNLLAMSKCDIIEGNPQITFWCYLIVRSIADIFPVAAVALIDAMILIMTHEHKGDFGHELVWGTLGFATFAPIVGYLLTTIDLPSPWPPWPLPFFVFAALMLVSAILLAAVPLHPEWQARRLRSYLPRLVHSGETAVLLFVLTLLGIFWGAMESYLPRYVYDKNDISPLLIGLTATVGALPAIPFLWNSERVVDYCGHANLLIIAFTFYIVRFTGLSFISNPWWTLICEALEVFTMSLMWVVAVLYMHHLAPRHLTATGQALATVAHFCIGRCLGAVIAGYGSAWLGEQLFYKCAAVAAAIIATLYLIIYHCCMKPRCMQRVQNQDSLLEGPLTNGTYTPLRVYHNGQGKNRIRY